MAERTRKARVKHGGQVLVKTQSRGNDIGFVHNVSESGMLLSTNHRYSHGSDVMIYLPLRIGFKKTLCMIAGTVLRKHPLSSRSNFGYGIKFAEDTSASSQKLLAKYVEFKRTGKVPEKTDPRAKRLSPYRD